MRCELMSLRSAACGPSPRVTARPPQNGSTNRLEACGRQSSMRRGKSQRFPPAHFRGGFKLDNCASLPEPAEDCVSGFPKESISPKADIRSVWALPGTLFPRNGFVFTIAEAKIAVLIKLVKDSTLSSSTSTPSTTSQTAVVAMGK